MTRFTADDLSLLVWVDTDEGDVLGPVEPTEIRLQAGREGFDFALVLEFPLGGLDHDVHPRSTRVHLGGRVGVHPMPAGARYLRASDTLTVVQLLEARFDQ